MGECVLFLVWGWHEKKLCNKMYRINMWHPQERGVTTDCLPAWLSAWLPHLVLANGAAYLSVTAMKRRVDILYLKEQIPRG